jgi:formate-dependent phosphoribosylglycinamide formyltransferase (GAR transformylase)
MARRDGGMSDLQMRESFPCEACKAKAAAADLTIHVNPIRSRADEEALAERYRVQVMQSDYARQANYIIASLVEQLGGTAVVDERVFIKCPEIRVEASFSEPAYRITVVHR